MWTCSGFFSLIMLNMVLGIFDECHIQKYTSLLFCLVLSLLFHIIIVSDQKCQRLWLVFVRFLHYCILEVWIVAWCNPLSNLQTNGNNSSNCGPDGLAIWYSLPKKCYVWTAVVRVTEEGIWEAERIWICET